MKNDKVVSLTEENKKLKQQISSYKFLSQFTPEQCRYLESNQKKLKKENEELKDKNICFEKEIDLYHKKIAELKERLGE